MSGSEREIEELILKESIVSATGLRPDSVQVGIKGDPSLRETAAVRPKYRNVMDDIFGQIAPRLADLLLTRGTYRIYIGFNSAEVRTTSIFDPLREETHAAERFVDEEYVDRHFPSLPFEEKVQAMRDIYTRLMESRLYSRLPGYWRSIFEKRHASWRPMEKERIPAILSTLKVLRDMPDYYLRSATLCIVQDLIRMQFNCDGTQLVHAGNYAKFLEENFGT
jgi:hypothetical protein